MPWSPMWMPKGLRPNAFCAESPGRIGRVIVNVVAPGAGGGVGVGCAGPDAVDCADEDGGGDPPLQPDSAR